MPPILQANCTTRAYDRQCAFGGSRLSMHSQLTRCIPKAVHQHHQTRIMLETHGCKGSSYTCMVNKSIIPSLTNQTLSSNWIEQAVYALGSGSFFKPKAPGNCISSSIFRSLAIAPAAFFWWQRKKRNLRGPDETGWVRKSWNGGPKSNIAIRLFTPPVLLTIS